MEAGVWGCVCDTRCKQGCIYLFGVSGWSQWKLVFGGVCVIRRCKQGCIYLFGVSGWSQWKLVFGGVCVIRRCKQGCQYIYLVFQGGVSGSWCLGGG